MRKLLFVCLLLGPAAQAQVIECPKFYPWEDTALAVAPPNHKGKGLVGKTSLDGATLTIGAVNNGTELRGDIKKVKGGRTVEYHMTDGPKWFVCHYGRDVAWWEELDNKVSRCKLEIKNKNSEGMMDATLTCK